MGIFDDCPVTVACKTGTVQSEKSLTNELINNGVFVCYAPADKPQIAISVVVEKGTSGATIADIARDIVNYYFRSQPGIVLAGDNKLQP
jgi:penicillin-binding protein 2